MQCDDYDDDDNDDVDDDNDDDHIMMIKQTIMPGARPRHGAVTKFNGLRDCFFLKWGFSKNHEFPCDEFSKDQT